MKKMYSLGSLMRYILVHFSSPTIKKKKSMSENTNFYLCRQLPFFAAQTSARAARAEEGDFLVCRCLKPNTITLNNKLNREPGCEDLAARVKN